MTTQTSHLDYESVPIKKLSLERLNKLMKKGEEAGFWDYDESQLHNCLNGFIEEEIDRLAEELRGY